MRLLYCIPFFLAISCQSMEFIKEFIARADHVPLQKFRATDTNFFPSFIDKIFTSTKKFENEFSSLDLAAKDFRLIGLKRLTVKDANVNEANLSWSADGVFLGYEEINKRNRKILIRDLMGSYSHSVFLMPKKEESLYQDITGGEQISFNAGLRWSLDSTQYAFMSNGGIGQFDIYWGGIGLRDKKISSSHSKDGFAVWSPSANEIVFVSGRSGNGDLYLLNFKKDQQVQLTFSKEPDLFPEWYPDGNAIIFTKRSQGIQQLFYLKKHRGVWKKKPYQLTKLSSGVFRPAFSRDGQKIAFYTKNKNSHRYSLVMATLKILLKNRGNSRDFITVADDVVPDLITGPTFSPDGNYLFYVKNDLTLFNPIMGHNIKTSKSFLVPTNTQMNRDVMISNLGVLSFRAQVGAWDRVYIALTNSGIHFSNNFRKNENMAKR